jgi:hypothetical protein
MTARSYAVAHLCHTHAVLAAGARLVAMAPVAVQFDASKRVWIADPPAAESRRR